MIAAGVASALFMRASGQTTLPQITVAAPEQKLRAKPKHHLAIAPKGSTNNASDAARHLATESKTFDAARENILPKVGTNTYSFDRETIETLPQGTNAPVSNVLLQAPGVSQETGVSFEGPVHIRLEHGFIQNRVNGILLPDGATGFTQFLDAAIIRNLALITGALPAQYGFRTSGIVDVTTRTELTPGGTVGIYGGSRETLTPYFQYGGSSGTTEYFVTGRYFQSSEGLENPIPTLNAIHDQTYQGKFFAYGSKLIDDDTRVSVISGSSVSRFQIPNNPEQVPIAGALPVPGVTEFNSSLLNERQIEQNFYNVVALQKKSDDADVQLSYFSRYSNVHFIPDPEGDLFFNNVSSDVVRAGLLNGVQGDGAFRINKAHTLRAGLIVSGEQTENDNSSIVLATAPGGACGSAAECVINDNVSKLGWMLGLYVQDEWRITDRLTLNAGLRFDQIWQFVDANQVSPRVSVVYRPFEGTTLHAGYARYFTPASQLLAAPSNLSLYENTTLAPAIPLADPVLPERSHYFDVGVVQKLLPGLEVGLAAYYKLARDQIDVGQFGQAHVLNEFNYERGENRGIEAKVIYRNGDFRAHGNLAWAQQFGTNIVSQQFLFDPATFAYVATHKIYTDLSQTLTGSAGLIYLWQGTRFSADMIYGSGLRAGFANTEHMASYAQFNIGVAHDFTFPGAVPVTLRFDVINVFDTIYELRNGTGIGVFAPQFGPRRGYFAGLSQKF
jgi:outer membrane receptor protein involved in Fe transport